MSFYISKKDGELHIDHSINDNAMFYVEFNYVNEYKVIPVNFSYTLPLGMNPCIRIVNSSSKNEYGVTVYDYEIIVHLNKSEQSSVSVRIDFSSKRPLGVVHWDATNRIEKAVLNLWKILNLFDSINEVEDVVSTLNVLEYRDPNELSEKIESLTHIMDKYKDKLPYFLRNDIVEWIRKALIRFGLSTQRLSQLDFKQFSSTVKILNEIGYQVFKCG